MPWRIYFKRDWQKSQNPRGKVHRLSPWENVSATKAETKPKGGHDAARWDTDVLAEDPDWLFISIGINDVWRQLDRNGVGAVYMPEYEGIYRSLLEKTRAAAKASICLMETGVISEDLNSEGNKLLKPYNEAIHRLAEEFGLTVVPINQDFRRCITARPEIRLTGDGVHPTPVRHMVMALSVLGSVGW